MKNMTLILIGAIAFNGFAINKIVIPKRASPGVTITASNTNENLDTIANKFNKSVDSNDVVYIRFKDLSSGDSTLVSKRADFDTTTSDTANITGGLKATRATITSAGIGAETVTRSTIDSLRNRMGYFDSIYVAQKMRAESLYVSGGSRFTRMYSPVADIDSFIGSVKFGGSILGTEGSNALGIVGANSADNSFGVNIQAGTSANDYALSVVNRSFGSRLFAIFGNGYCGILKNPTVPLDVNGHLKSSSSNFAGACTSSTINTGNGDFEIGQSNLTSGSVTYKKVSVTDTLIVGSSDKDTITSNSMADTSFWAHIEGCSSCSCKVYLKLRFGIIYVYVERFSATYDGSGGAGGAFHIPMPTDIKWDSKTGNYVQQPYLIRYNSNYEDGIVRFTTGVGYVDISRNNNTFKVDSLYTITEVYLSSIK